MATWRIKSSSKPVPLIPVEKTYSISDIEKNATLYDPILLLLW